MPLRERLIDFAVPERSFKGELNSEIEACLDFFENPWMVKGIGITVGKLGKSGRKRELLDMVRREQRGCFWEKDGIRHMVGQEAMTRKKKDDLVNAIQHITFPYAQELAGRKQS